MRSDNDADYVGVIIWVREQSGFQLLGTIARNKTLSSGPGRTRSVALQTGLLLTVAVMCKRAEPFASRRLAAAHCALVFNLYVSYNLLRNSALLPAGCAFNEASGATGRPGKVVLSLHIALFALVLCVLDVTSDMVANVSLRPRRHIVLTSILSLLDVFDVYFADRQVNLPAQISGAPEDEISEPFVKERDKAPAQRKEWL